MEYNFKINMLGTTILVLLTCFGTGSAQAQEADPQPDEEAVLAPDAEATPQSGAETVDQPETDAAVQPSSEAIVQPEAEAEPTPQAQQQSASLLQAAVAAPSSMPPQQGATQERRRHNNIMINPIGLLIGGLSLTYSRELQRHVSLGFSFLYIMPLFVPFHGIGGEISFGFWPRFAHSGFFVDVVLQVARTIPREEGDFAGLFSGGSYLGAVGLAPAARLGWRWLFGSGFNLGLGVLAGYNFAVWEEDCPEGYECELIGGGFKFGLVFDLGIAF